MSTNVVSNSIGQADFKVIHIDAADVASAFQSFVNQGSRLTGVSIDDISTNVVRLPADPRQATIVELLEIGMKLFDAVVWVTANRPSDHELVVDPTMTSESIPSLQKIAKAVFYTFFFVLTQARYPASRNEQRPPSVPNFLRIVMGLDAEQYEYIDMLCSFNPKDFDPKWVRWVSFDGLGQEALSRFGLGVAGYRMFTPFKVYDPKPDMPASLMSAFNFARTVARSRATWDIHPTTRHPDVLTKRGNLNKNLGNLILESFTDDQIDEMIKSKMLYQKPVKEPNYRNYHTWGEENDISGSQYIFRAN